MRIASSLPFYLSVVASILATSEGHATESEELSRTLATAETAYEQVDFGTTYKVACNALQTGSATVQQTLRLHILCAIAAAALEKAEESRTHFKVVLAIRPDLHLDRELSPKMRSPYLEAQGYWSHYEDRLSIRPSQRSNWQRIQLRVIDPANLGSNVRVYWRSIGQSAFAMLEKKSASVIAVELHSMHSEDGIEYYATLTDERGNAIAELANESEPLEISVPQPKPTPSASPTPAARRVDSAESRSLWLPITLVGVGAAAAGAGAYFNVVRENAAHKWNGAECESPGLTRAEQCGSVDTDRRRAELSAIALYATGGILLTTGVVLWALPGADSSRSRQARTGSDTRLTCATALPLSVFCIGRF